ncbi:MAG: ABC transporter ATP-binding protein [Bacillota bacterium]|nr:ABC transporter ATP-binding protein [Bacillota bacterium]
MNNNQKVCGSKASDILSIKEMLWLSLRGYQIWWAENPQLLPATAAYAAVSSLSPYVGIWLLARLIDEIAGSCDSHMLMVLTAAELIQAAVFKILSAGLERWKDVQWAGIWHTQNKIFMTKLLSMDFAAVSNPHIQELRFQIWQNSNSGAWGLYKLLFCLEDMVKSVVSIGGAIVLTIPLFTLSVPKECGGLAILNNPLFMVIMIASIFTAALLAPFFSIKANDYWVKYSNEHKMGNRLFSFWLGELGSDRTRALDVRIYRQDVLSKSNLEQNNPFNGKSKLAKAAKGPMGGFRALSGAASQIYVGIAYIFVCLKALGGAFGVGSIMQYIGSITALSGRVSSFMQVLGDLRNNTAFLRTSFEFLDMPDSINQGSQIMEKKRGEKYKIEFRNVSFRYPGQESYALRNVSLTFHAGCKLAVVGMNGSGKTTFIKLLCRLYSPTEGEILLNEVDIRTYDYYEYISILSVVFQDFKLLSFALGQNIAAKVNYNDDKAERCLYNASFGERFNRLPEGLKTILYKDFDDKGVNISGGEAQKIALARALYKNAVFIVLDEPTAALDPIAEFEVYDRMNEMVGDKSAVFISHRLSSCRFCKDIVVFHEGRLIQRGSHNELVADKSGKYYELWNAQAQYYIVKT